jgi:DNA-binding transcriptional ArsR family regulator
MTDHKPDYEAPADLHLETIDQHRALFEPTRMEIIRMLGQRASTVSQLAEALDRPKGTIGHHMDVLDREGLVRVVRTEKVRAIEAKYWGRTARTFVYGEMSGIAKPSLLSDAAEEFPTEGGLAAIRYAQIDQDRAEEWRRRLADLAAEFASEPVTGDTTFGFVVGLYPTRRPTLPS